MRECAAHQDERALKRAAPFVRHQLAVIGGGIVGLATAYKLLARFPKVRILVLEKEKEWAFHQTGHNSGVIHSGIYYKPGSLKARLSQSGGRELIGFCREQGIPYEICGKVIVATSAEELPRLQSLYQRGTENGLAVELLDPRQLKEIEPHCAGIAAIRVPEAGIVSYKQVAARLVALMQERGVELRLDSQVRGLRATTDSVHLQTDSREYETEFVVNCGGLQSDRIAVLMGLNPPARIVPFRGEYYNLVPERSGLVKSLIYPVPDPAFPFLGVHFTRMINGEIHAGPNAVLSLKREGYSKTSFDLRDFGEVMRYRGFWKLAARHWKMGGAEYMRSFSKKLFTRSLQKLIPEICEADLVPSVPGIRAQALDPNGKLVDDFMILDGPRSMHVCNAPSPAATASLSIGQYLSEAVAVRYAPDGA